MENTIPTPPAAPIPPVNTENQSNLQDKSEIKGDNVENDKGTSGEDNFVVNPEDFIENQNIIDSSAPTKGEEDEEVDPNVKRMESHEQYMYELKRKDELNDFIESNPEFAPYRSELKKVVTHPAFRSLKTKAAIYAALGDRLQIIGAEKERKASVQQKRNSYDGVVQNPKVKDSSWQNLEGQDFVNWMKKNNLA